MEGAAGVEGAAGAAQLDFIDALFESEEPAAEVERPRSWIDLAAGSDPSQQLEASLRHVIAHVERHGPYDGAFGFSQGAAILTMLSDASTRRALGCSRPLWRFVVLACGVDMTHYACGGQWRSWPWPPRKPRREGPWISVPSHSPTWPTALGQALGASSRHSG